MTRREAESEELAQLLRRNAELETELDRTRRELDRTRIEHDRELARVEEAKTAALEDALRRYRQFVELSTEAIWRFDIDPPVDLDLAPEAQAELLLQRGRLGECNEAFARRFGVSRVEDVLGLRTEAVMAGTREDKLAALAAAARKGHSLRDHEAAATDAFGGPWLTVNNVTPVLADGRLVAVWGTQRDVTAQRRAEAELASALASFQQFMSLSREAVYCYELDPPLSFGIDPDERARRILDEGRLVQCNDAYARRHGWKSAAELIGRAVKDVLPGSREHQLEFVKRTLAMLTPAASGGFEPTGFEIEEAHGGAASRWYLVHFVAIVADGLLSRVWGTSSDITDRKRAEAEAHAANQRYRQFLELAHDAVFRYDAAPPIPLTVDRQEVARAALAQFRLAECNDAYARRHGRERASDLVGARLSEILPGSPEQQIAFLARHMSAMLESLEAVDRTAFEVDDAREGAAPRTLLTSIVGVVDRRHLVRLWGTQTDITDRKRAEEEAYRATERYRQFLDLGAEAVARLEIDPPIDVALPAREQARLLLERSQIVECNPACARLLGLSSVTEAIGHSYRDFLVGTPEQHVAMSVAFVEHGYRVVDFEVALARDLIAQLNVTGVVETGHLVRMWTASRDVTARRRAEDALVRARDDLEQRVLARTHELTIANQRLSELDRLKSQFLASMSHELRTPLNSIIGFSQVLRDGVPGPINDEQRTQLDITHSSALHLLSLINDLLDLSRIEAGRVDLDVTTFDLVAVVREVLAQLAPLAEPKGLALVADVVDSSLSVTGDRMRVLQVLLNLVGNGIKFTSRGSVTVSVRRTEARVAMTVTDTGIGIRPDQLGNLFEAFRQLDGSSRRLYEGTGLGLYLCKKLVGMMGGEIGVTSAAGVGSAFTVTLPITTPRADHR